MKKDKYLTFGWSGFRMLTMMLMGIFVMASCKDDDADGAAYVRISDDFKELSYDPQGGQQGYEMYTNLKNWTLETVYQTQSEGWVDVFDTQGSGDGRFVVTVNPNTTHPFERRAEVHVVSGGVIYETIKIRQAGVSPYLEVDLGGLTAVSVTNKSTTTVVNLKTNVLWEVDIPAEAKEWLSLGESTATSQTFAFTANPNDGNREALVRFYMVGTGNETVNATVQIIQRGMSSDPEKAQLMTIKSFVETVSGIAPNVKVEGVVVSDPASENFPANACFIQDESGRGMYLEFTSATGPRYFTIEWAESEDATTWATIGTYESVDWNSNYQLLQYAFDLPAEMKGKQNVVLRMRVNHSDEARNKPSSSSPTGITSIASGGTNRIGVLSVVELK